MFALRLAIGRSGLSRAFLLLLIIFMIQVDGVSGRSYFAFASPEGNHASIGSSKYAPGTNFTSITDQNVWSLDVHNGEGAGNMFPFPHIVTTYFNGGRVPTFENGPPPPRGGTGAVEGLQGGSAFTEESDTDVASGFILAYRAVAIYCERDSIPGYQEPDTGNNFCGENSDADVDCLLTGAPAFSASWEPIEVADDDEVLSATLREQRGLFSAQCVTVGADGKRLSIDGYNMTDQWTRAKCSMELSNVWENALLLGAAEAGLDAIPSLTRAAFRTYLSAGFPNLGLDPGCPSEDPNDPYANVYATLQMWIGGTNPRRAARPGEEPHEASDERLDIGDDDSSSLWWKKTATATYEDGSTAQVEVIADVKEYNVSDAFASRPPPATTSTSSSLSSSTSTSSTTDAPPVCGPGLPPNPACPCPPPGRLPPPGGCPTKRRRRKRQTDSGSSAPRFPPRFQLRRINFAFQVPWAVSYQNQLQGLLWDPVSNSKKTAKHVDPTTSPALTAAPTASTKKTTTQKPTSSPTTQAAMQPDECTHDFDGDGSVTISDLATLLSAWGACVVVDDCPTDADGNGSTEITDLATLLSAWGDC